MKLKVQHCETALWICNGGNIQACSVPEWNSRQTIETRDTTGNHGEDMPSVGLTNKVSLSSVFFLLSWFSVFNQL